MARKAKAVAKRSRSRSVKKVAAKKAAPKAAKKVVAKKAAPAKKAGGRGKAMGPWLKKVHKAKNGATYVKNARGQVRFVTGASKKYMAKLRKMRGKKGKK
jgi:hypothetical protein